MSQQGEPWPENQMREAQASLGYILKETVSMLDGAFMVSLPKLSLGLTRVREAPVWPEQGIYLNLSMQLSGFLFPLASVDLRRLLREECAPREWHWKAATSGQRSSQPPGSFSLALRKPGSIYQPAHWTAGFQWRLMTLNTNAQTVMGAHTLQTITFSALSSLFMPKCLH